MPSWLLASFILVVWCLWAVAAAAQRAARDAHRGILKERGGGVSILPVVSVFPIVLWVMAWLIDRAVSPWGTWAVGVAHGVFATCLAVSLVRDWRRLRSLEEVARQGH